MFFGFIFLLFLATVAVIVVTTTLRMREYDRRALLWALAAAAEKGIPLSAAARAFAEERRGGVGRGARRLADSLEDGMPLDLALDDAHVRLPSDGVLAARIGCQTGTLDASLKASTGAWTSLDPIVQGLVVKVLYVTFFALYSTLVITFLRWKIMPAFDKILRDFGIPGVNVYYKMNQWVLDYSFVMHYALLVLIALFVYVLGRYIGLLRWDLPGVQWMMRPLDDAVVLRALARLVDRGQALARPIAALGEIHPKMSARVRLSRAANRINAGMPWCDGLRSVGMLRSAEAGLLKSAERVGNLSWALNEVAERKVRRFVAYCTAIMAIVFPLVTLAMATVVALVAVSVMLTLAKLIQNLT